MDKDEILKWAITILRREQDQGLYGTVSFTFAEGEIKTSRVEKTEKPNQLTRK